MLGDTGVAVNPDDERYRDLIGKRVVLPLMDRADPGRRRRAGRPEVRHRRGEGDAGARPQRLRDGPAPRPAAARASWTTDGVINDDGGAYAGLDRFEARKRIVADLEAQGLLEKTEPYRVPVRRC